ncbi:sulfate transporter family-domain-containing protein [Thamnocephalis sphaerospora]|uniref:Sulfate transporter family-domain-containing protein n=1 Tax=Thamnocephalis sphaerospora TaxID=78915 RepID=A0A4V1IXH1_9FUNG|nr:sulfate transporter family-domain-containing protein [Thamnocephalis sphaerospora]|eukprot:RKP11039.1 sulfate transporter family-domain-containing protein [Thamnocephalis sphaerospora]
MRSIAGQLEDMAALATIVIPQSMAYALLAGLPPVYGLYTSTVPVLVYAIFGSCRHMSIGTFALTSMLLGQAVTHYMSTHSHADSSIKADAYAHAALRLSLLTGLFQLTMGLLRVGRVTSLLMPDALISGFTTGAAFYIATSQVPNLFGFSVTRSNGPGGLLFTWMSILLNLGRTHLPTLLLGVSAMVAILLLGRLERWRLKRRTTIARAGLHEDTPLLDTPATMRSTGRFMHIPVPDVLLVIAGAILVTSLLHLDQRYAIAVVGDIPSGLPPFLVPHGLTNWSEIQPLLWPAFMIACIGYVLTISIAKTFSTKFAYSVSEDRELIAIGLSSICGAFFSCYLSCGSLTRSVVLSGANPKTKVAGAISAVTVLLTLGLFTRLFHSLPLTVLAAVIVLACRSLISQLAAARRLWTHDRSAWRIWTATFLAVLFLDVQLGAAVGIGAVLLERGISRLRG